MRRALFVTAALAACAFAACTTFDGLVASDQTPDASAPVDAPTADTAPPPPPAGGGHDVGPDAPAAPVGFLSLDDAAKVCARTMQCPNLASSIISSIAVPVDPTNFSACMDWLAGPLPTSRVGVAVQAGIFKCIAAATTCVGAATCLPIENFGPNDPRCDAGAGVAASPERCADDGGTVLRCKDTYALHCTSAYYANGSHCLVGQDKSHWCALNTNCTVQDSCLGTLLDYCGSPSNLHESINCAASGYACGVDVEAGSPDCLSQSTVEQCPSPGSSCSGAVVLVCDGFQQAHFDCATLGGTCSTQGGPARCVRKSDTCTPFDATVNTCSGTSVSLCVGGKAASFDCASVGLSCKAAMGALSGRCE
jgi:hypothetical protein